MSPRLHSCRALLEARGRPPLSRMLRCNSNSNERPASLGHYQIWSPLSKGLSRKPCTACQTWTRSTSCLNTVTRAHPNPRIRTSPSTTYQGTPTPHRRIILKRRCRSSVQRECSRNWTLRRCFTSSITTLGRINSKHFPKN